MVPLGPFAVTSVNVEVTPDIAAAFVVTQTWPPEGTGGPLGPAPSVVTYITCEPLASNGPPAASARTTFTSFPLQVPVPNVSKLRLNAVKAPPVRGPRHTRQVPTNSEVVDCESRI